MSVKFASSELKEGEVYTRKALAGIFKITDATLNTGVFRPKGHNSIFLFVTKHKVPNQTQYKDHLAADILHWQGQSSGKSDLIIVEHEERGLEVLLFYRENKNQYGESGFRYEGPFEYVKHGGGRPTDFVFRKIR
jgi:putative restriction endonuclease